MNFCKLCEADLDKTEGQHFGSCPEHPTNKALLKRVTGQREDREQSTERDPNQTNLSWKNEMPKFVLPEATMILPQETIQKAMEVFFKEAMGLTVEVTAFSINEPVATAAQAFAVTFKGKS